MDVKKLQKIALDFDAACKSSLGKEKEQWVIKGSERLLSLVGEK